MDIITFVVLATVAFIFGMIAIVLPSRPATLRALALFIGAFGVVLAVLTSIQLISDGSLAIASTLNSSGVYVDKTVGIYPIAYIPFLIALFDGIASVSRMVY